MLLFQSFMFMCTFHAFSLQQSVSEKEHVIQCNVWQNIEFIL